MKQLTISEIHELARAAMIENGFVPDLPKTAMEAAENIGEEQINALAADTSVRDLRALLWSSIDNTTSRDLDQAEFAEALPNGSIRLLVAIADVDAFVPKGSIIDAAAAQNTTSVYTGVSVFPMLPERLSTNLSSLNEGEDRLSVVTEMIVCADGRVETSDVFRAFIHNYAKLTYEETGAWLDGQAAMPESVKAVSGLEQQIRLQHEAAARLYKLRKENGALEFESNESAPIVENGKITAIKLVAYNSARRIIENFMIAANVEMAEFLEKRNVLSLRRVVKTPERWNKIVEIAAEFGTRLPENPDSIALADFLETRRASDALHYPDLSLAVIKLVGAGDYMIQAPDETIDGHFGLAVQDYTHSTAPNRRFVDLIVQRLVKAALRGNPPPYTPDELSAIAEHCNKRESASKKVERRMRKTIAASVMSASVGDVFESIVTGITPRGTFARVIKPPFDGRVVQNEEGLEVGDKIKVRLIKAVPERGFIDFARVVKKK